jgi:hypothetical protein
VFASVYPHAVPAAVHLYQQPHDWLIMGAIVVAFAIPELISRLRYRRWRRDVLAACR